jgi:hypothetical protein
MPAVYRWLLTANTHARSRTPSSIARYGTSVLLFSSETVSVQASSTSPAHL